MTVLGFGENFANVMAMKVSADQRHVLVEGPQKSSQDSDMTEDEMTEMHNRAGSSSPQPLQGLDSLLKNTFQLSSDQPAPALQKTVSTWTMKDSATLLRLSFEISQVAFTQMGLA